jgi:hypothetical protein
MNEVVAKENGSSGIDVHIHGLAYAKDGNLVNTSSRKFMLSACSHFWVAIHVWTNL